MEIVFRVSKDGEVVAVFPYVMWNIYEHTLTCYAHVGQHGACSWMWARHETRPAKPEEYAGLLDELTRMGYTDLRVLNRLPPWEKCYEKY